MTERTRDRATLVTFLLVTFSVGVIFFRMIGPYILTLLMGGILAVLLNPIYKKLIKKKIRPKLAALGITLLMLLIVLGPVAGMGTLAIKQGISLGEKVSQEGYSTSYFATQISKFPGAELVAADVHEMEKRIQSSIRNGGKTLSASLLAKLARLPNFILLVALCLIGLFFFLIDGKNFVRWVFQKLPMDKDVEDKLIESFKTVAVSVVWSTLAAGGAQAAIILAGFLLLGVPSAFFASAATFVLAWIPMVGSTPVWVIATIYLYKTSGPGMAVIMLIIGGITGIIDNVVRAFMLKGQSNMHPLVSLVSIFGGINIFGILGVFIGPILMAILIELLEVWPVVGRRVGIDFSGTGKA